MAEKSDRAKREEEILQFWQDNDIFKKTLEKPSPEGEFVFYEGPPTANGRPGIHHVEARAFKDAIPRYKTMRGFHVRRKAGWDTHGLPVELEVEKQLGLKSKKEIESYGVAEFNEKCKESVWKYVDEWQKFSARIGFWVDMDHPYVTYHNSYIESVWNIIAEVEKKKLLYKDYKVVPWCPRCGTALSSHELAQGYKDVKDLSVYVGFKLKKPETLGLRGDVYLVAWTTTPWTLPGNIALAVGEEIEYVVLRKTNSEAIIVSRRTFVHRADLFEGYMVQVGFSGEKDKNKLEGKDLVGLEYEPLYPFTGETYKGEAMEKAYHVYPAKFVTTEDGTGIVHTSVMYGQDDFELGNEVGLPKHHLVDETGHFLPGTGFLEGKFVKDEETDVLIIKDLAGRGLLFKKEKYEHSYPFCWRCQTPLIYYARDSWYIRMSELRDELVKENEKINWEPDHIKEGRFGDWLREVKDWAISRERYWGTPLPVWVRQTGNNQTPNTNNQEYFVVDSIDTLKRYSKKSGNKFIGMRHGEGEHNVANICSADPEYPHHLTEEGKDLARKNAEKLKKEGITKIVTSPFVRTRETADIVADVLGFPKSEIVVDERLSEYKYGEFNLKSRNEYIEWRKTHNDFYTAPSGGESLFDAKKRFSEFIYNTDYKYNNETVLFISHGIAFEVMPHIVAGNDVQKTWDNWHEQRIKTGEFETYNFVPLPHNANFELDLHKPYIDEVVLEKDGEEYTRAKEVMDVWLDSGSMPFAQDHYPFEEGELVYPADFISEAIDQTRGWFYTLHAIGVLMGKGIAFKNVICLGLLLDKEGKKMSKSLGNVVDPWEMADKYGVDAMRLWMYSVNQPGESKNFDEKNLDEINRRLFNMLDNVHSFLGLYTNPDFSPLNPQAGSDTDEKSGFVPSHVLDKWILARLNELIELTTNSLDNYKLIEPSRAFRDFVDDLSTWYLRRSRDRIKEGDSEAINTLYYVLKTFAKVIAPFAPFAAEDLYQKLRKDNDLESVHLESWPTAEKGTGISEMAETRRLASLALEQRQKANIKVRQPLQKLIVKTELADEYLELIKDELNVKEVVVDTSLETDVELDTTLTPELEAEGKMRDLVREIQDMRKEKGLVPGEKMKYEIKPEEKELFEKFGEEIKKTTDIEV